MRMNKTFIMLLASVALVGLMASQGAAQTEESEDTTVYAGGSADFDESAGGEVIDEPQPVDVGVIDPVDPVDDPAAEAPCTDCNTVVGDGDGGEGAAITVEEGGVEVAPTRGTLAEEGGASPEVMRADTGASPARVRTESHSSEDNAACIKRVGRSQAHRCMN